MRLMASRGGSHPRANPLRPQLEWQAYQPYRNENHCDISSHIQSQIKKLDHGLKGP